MKKKFVRFIGVPMILLALLMSTVGYAKGDRILYDFENKSNLDRFEWKCFTLFSISRAHVTSGKYSLKLGLYPSNYPQLLTKTLKRDLSGYQAISLDIFNAEERKIPVYVRIDDRKKTPDYGDRYTGFYTLEEGKNRIVIPLKNVVTESGDRSLDLSRIYRLFVFMKHPERRTVLYIDNIRLLGQSDNR